MRFLASVFLLSAPLFQGEPQRTRWDGFGSGSWVETTLSNIGSGEPRHWMYTRDELAGKDGSGAAILRSYSKKQPGDAFLPCSGPGFPRLKGFDVGMTERSRRREERVVGAKTLSCDVVEYASPETEIGLQSTLTSWRAEGVALPPREMGATAGQASVPSDVIRAIRVERRGAATLTVTIEVVDLNASLDIGERKLDCAVETSVSTYDTGNGSVILRAQRRWFSASVPGGVVRRERQCTDSKTAKPGDYNVREEVTAFHVEP